LNAASGSIFLPVSEQVEGCYGTESDRARRPKLFPDPMTIGFSVNSAFGGSRVTLRHGSALF
jgi:hypothetical protein